MSIDEKPVRRCARAEKKDALDLPPQPSSSFQFSFGRSPRGARTQIGAEHTCIKHPSKTKHSNPRQDSAWDRCFMEAAVIRSGVNECVSNTRDLGGESDNQISARFQSAHSPGPWAQAKW